jgi:hypothetical protein
MPMGLEQPHRPSSPQLNRAYHFPIHARSSHAIIPSTTARKVVAMNRLGRANREVQVPTLQTQQRCVTTVAMGGKMSAGLDAAVESF